MTDSETMKKIHRVVNLDKQAQICEEYHQKQLELTAVVQEKSEVCQCYSDEIGMYMKGIEYYCASCDLPIKAN